MKKKIFSLSAILALCLTLCIGIHAASLGRLTDAAGLLTEKERISLQKKLDAYSDELDFDLVIVTLPSTDGRSTDDLSWDIYRQNAFRENGAILLVSMEDRDWIITSCGDGQKSLNEDARNHLADLFVGELTNGNYDLAFHIFADESRALLLNYAQGVTYKTPFDLVPALLISVIVGAVAALLIVNGMKKKLKSVAPKCAASEYVTPGSLQLTQAHERFLYSHITRTAKPQNDRSSSSGGSHSSTGGKF